MTVFRLQSIRAKSPRPEATGGAHGTHWWLLADGRPVAYARTVLDPRVLRDPVLMEFEVRGEYRGLGLSRRLVSEVRNSVVGVLHLDGYRSPGGAAAASDLPLVPGADLVVSHEPMGFVQSWDTFSPRYP